MIIGIHLAEFTDQITADGIELTKLPYPLFVDSGGKVGRQDIWQGVVSRVIGFVSDLAVQQVDLSWHRAKADPQCAVGMYLITEDSAGVWRTHVTAVESVEMIY